MSTKACWFWYVVNTAADWADWPMQRIRTIPIKKDRSMIDFADIDFSLLLIYQFDII